MTSKPRTATHPRRGMRHMGRQVGKVISSHETPHVNLRWRLGWLLGATLALDAAATVLMYMFEHDEPGSGFHSIGGALFWVSAQLTTVSSQMPNPLTTGGRIVDIVLEVWAISVVATLAASLAAFFRHVDAGAGTTDGPPAA